MVENASTACEHDGAISGCLERQNARTHFGGNFSGKDDNCEVALDGQPGDVQQDRVHDKANDSAHAVVPQVPPSARTGRGSQEPGKARSPAWEHLLPGWESGGKEQYDNDRCGDPSRLSDEVQQERLHDSADNNAHAVVSQVPPSALTCRGSQESGKASSPARKACATWRGVWRRGTVLQWSMQRSSGTEYSGHCGI